MDHGLPRLLYIFSVTCSCNVKVRLYRFINRIWFKQYNIIINRARINTNLLAFSSSISIIYRSTAFHENSLLISITSHRIEEKRKIIIGGCLHQDWVPTPERTFNQLQLNFFHVHFPNDVLDDLMFQLGYGLLLNLTFCISWERSQLFTESFLFQLTIFYLVHRASGTKIFHEQDNQGNIHQRKILERSNHTLPPAEIEPRHRRTTVC